MLTSNKTHRPDRWSPAQRTAKQAHRRVVAADLTEQSREETAMTPTRTWTRADVPTATTGTHTAPLHAEATDAGDWFRIGRPDEDLHGGAILAVPETHDKDGPDRDGDVGGWPAGADGAEATPAHLFAKLARHRALGSVPVTSAAAVHHAPTIAVEAVWAPGTDGQDG